MTHFLFIDTSVDDIDVLQANTSLGTVVYRISDNVDGVDYITQILAANRSPSDHPQVISDDITISIVAHGAPGTFGLGNAALNLASLKQYSDRIQQWFSGTPRLFGQRGRLQLYSCDVASGTAGKALIDCLHQLTGATVHASTTKIGSARLGGNWHLDALADTWSTMLASIAERVQATKPRSPFTPKALATYSEILADPVATNNAFSIDRGIEAETLGNLITDDNGFGTDSDADGDTLTVSAIGGSSVTAGDTTVTTQLGILGIQPDGSYTYRLDNSNPNVVSASSGDILTDNISYTVTDGTTASTATLEITINGNDSFSPDTNLFYQNIEVGDEMQFVFYNPLIRDYEVIRTLPFDVNALAYNPLDNFLYAFASQSGTDDFDNSVAFGTLVRIDNQGRVLGQEISVPDTFAGDFDAQGNYWIRDDESLTRVDISTGDQTTFTITGDGTNIGVADLVYTNGTLYGAKGRTLVSFDIENPSGSTITRTDIRVPGLPAGVYGAAWADSNGRLYVGLNEGDHDGDGSTPDTGAIFEVVDYLGTSPSVELQAIVSATSKNDGAFNNNGLSPFAAPFIDLGDRLPTVAETTFTENGDPTSLFTDVELLDPDSLTQVVTNVSLTFSEINDGANEILYANGQPLNLGSNGSVSVTAGGTDFTLTYSATTGAIAVTQTGGGTLPLEDLEILLKSLAYENQSEDPSSNNRGLVIDITDVDSNTSRAVGLIQVVPENDPPVLDLDSDATGTNDADYRTTFAKGGTPVNITDGSATITDVDDTRFTEITVTIGGIQDGTDEVLVVNGTEVPLSTDGTTTVSVEGIPLTATVAAGGLTFTDAAGGEIADADAEALLNTIVYQNQSVSPTEGDRTLQITINDGEQLSNLATSTITVALSGTPVATADADTTPEDTPVTIAVLSNDVPGDQPTTVSVAPGNEPTNGSVSVNPDGTITYTPDPDFFGADTFTYTITDEDGDTSMATVTVNVGTDTDGDGVPDSTDLDDDNDGILDSDEGNGTLDTDDDGVPDSLDLDADNDGILDVTEAGHDQADGDGNGQVDGSVGENGLPDAVETFSDSGLPVVSPVDTDGDGAPDFQDLDSDNDGLSDLAESGIFPDTNNDGQLDGPDTDGDGLLDDIDLVDGRIVVTDGGLVGGISVVVPLDTDNNGVPDFRELQNVTIKGSSGPDILIGTDQNEILSGFSDPDRLFGRGGDDILNGGSEVDLLVGGAGNDIVNGGSNDDIIRGNNGQDRLSGGSGNDRIIGGSGNDQIVGGDGEDIIRGGKGRDVLDGGGDRDKIFGGAKRDRIDGGDGNDLIVGGRGNDVLTGGEGADTFRYSKQKDGRDVITDFEIIKDVIDLKRVKGIDSVADLNLVQRGDNTLVQIPNGGQFKTIIRLESIEANDLDQRHFNF